MAQNQVTAPFSEEVNEFDKPFILSSSGTTTFGEVGEESGLTSAPIKLSHGENVKDENGVNHGYGWLHIEAEHGEQIRAAGFASVEEFVETVARNYDTIREGGIIADNQTYLLEISDEHNNTLFIQLSRDGSYWNVKSAGIFKKKYSRRKRKVFTRPAFEPDTNTDTSGVDSGQAEGVTTPAGNSPQTSDGKDSEKPGKVQGKGGKEAENQISTAEWNGHKVGDRYLSPNGDAETAVIIGFDYTHAGEGGMPEVLMRTLTARCTIWKRCENVGSHLPSRLCIKRKVELVVPTG